MYGNSASARFPIVSVLRASASLPAPAILPGRANVGGCVAYCR